MSPGDHPSPGVSSVTPNVEEVDDDEDSYSFGEDVCDALLVSPEPVEMPSGSAETLPFSWTLEVALGFQ